MKTFCILLTWAACVMTAQEEVAGQSLTLQPASVAFNFQLGGTAQAARSIVISSSGAAVPFTIAAPSAPWIVIDTTSGTTPATVHVSMYPVPLTQGTFTTVLTVTSPSAGSQSLPITLVVKEPPALIVTPTTLSFTCQQNFNPPVAQKISIAGQNSAYTVSATTVVGNWLYVDRSGGTTPDNVSVSVSSCALDPGTYTGLVFIAFAGVMNVPLQVQVTLNVVSASQLSVSPTAFSIAAQVGSVAAKSRTVSLVATGERINFISHANVNWLSITPDRGLTTTITNTTDGSIVQTPIPLTVKIDPTGLAAGAYSGTISIFPDDGTPPATVSVSFTIQGNRYRIPQVADGSNWKTTIILANTDAQPAPFTVNFYNADGTPLNLSVNQGTPASQYSDSIPVGGSRTLETPGQSDTLVQGWAEVIATGSISGTTIFRQQVSANVASEGSVPLQAATGQHFLLPFDNTGNFVTSLALLDPDPAQSAATSIAFRDENGQSISTHSFSLPAGNRQAFALPTQYPELANQRGVADITSSTVALSGFGLRFNPRGAFTSIQPINLDNPPAPGATGTISQIADGGQWQTTIILVNTGNAPTPFSLRFTQPGASAWSLPIAGLDGATEYSDVIPAGGSRILQTNATASAVSQGWGEIVSSGAVGGTVIFRQRLNPARDSEGAVPINLNTFRDFILPFDDTLGFSTAAAIANQDPSQSTSVSVVIRSPDGQVLGNESLNLGPFAQSAFSLPTRFQETGNTKGVVEFSSSNVDLTALGLRFNPLGSFTSVQPLQK